MLHLSLTFLRLVCSEHSIAPPYTVWKRVKFCIDNLLLLIIAYKKRNVKCFFKSACSGKMPRNVPFDIANTSQSALTAHACVKAQIKDKNTKPDVFCVCLGIYRRNNCKKHLTICAFYEIMRSIKLSIQNNYTLPKRVRRCIECSEHTSLRNVRERWSMALEREWLQLTVEKFSREDAQKAELVSHTKIEFRR